MELKVKNKQVKWFSEGVVVGTTWMGGKGAYKAEGLKAGTRTDLIRQIDEGIKDGSLDSGFGFQSLEGGFFIITKQEILMTEKGKYTKMEHEFLVMGNIDPFSEKDLLIYLMES